MESLLGAVNRTGISIWKVARVHTVIGIASLVVTFIIVIALISAQKKEAMENDIKPWTFNFTKSCPLNISILCDTVKAPLLYDENRKDRGSQEKTPLFLGLVQSPSSATSFNCTRVIVYLPDGPGNPSVTERNVELAETLVSGQPGSCVVLMDRRGSGGSKFLECPRGTSVYNLTKERSCARFIGSSETQRQLGAITYDNIARDLAFLVRSLAPAHPATTKVSIVAVGDSALPAVAFLKSHPDGMGGIVDRVLFDSPVSPDLGKRLRLERNQNLVAFATMSLCAEDAECRKKFEAEGRATGGNPMQALSMLRNKWDAARLNKFACEGMNANNKELTERCVEVETAKVCRQKEHEVREALALLMHRADTRNLLPAAVLRVLRCSDADAAAIERLLSSETREELSPEVHGFSELIEAHHNFGPLWKTLTEPSVSCFAMITVADAITVSTKRYSDEMCPARQAYFHHNGGGVGYDADYNHTVHDFHFINFYPRNGSVNVAMAIIQGNLDAVVPLAETVQFRASMANASSQHFVDLMVVENAAHVAIQTTAPSCALQAAAGFLHAAGPGPGLGPAANGNCKIETDFTGVNPATRDLAKAIFFNESLF